MLGPFNLLICKGSTSFIESIPIFLGAKHEKIIMGMQLFKFSQPYRKYIKTAKNGGFCEELLSENDFETVLINFCCYEYIIVSMLLRQFRSED